MGSIYISPPCLPVLSLMDLPCWFWAPLLFTGSFYCPLFASVSRAWPAATAVVVVIFVIDHISLPLSDKEDGDFAGLLFSFSSCVGRCFLYLVSGRSSSQ